jgi:uncharacterized membrane protein YheB (UPF0754 family)
MASWLILLLTVPLACGVIGWFTNVIAIKMIFRPRRMRRLLGVRLQGVLPKHLERFASQLAEIITGDFMTTAELVENLDVEAVLEKLEPEIEKHFEQITDELIGLLGPGQRAMITDEVIAMVRDKIEEEMRAAIPEVKAELVKRADELVDLQDMMTRKVVEMGPKHLEDIIYRISSRELKFIELYGGVFGFGIGLLQLLVLLAAPLSWELPVVGAIVGIITNYLAIQMLFYPREPKRFGPIAMQGLFPKRQQEIARAQAEVAAEELILVDEVFNKLRDQLLPDRVDPTMAEQVEAELTRRYPAVAGTVQAILTKEQLEQFKEILMQRFVDFAPSVADLVIRTASDYIDIERIMAEKITSLPKLRFEQLLRSLFKEEEIYLVIYGGLLGGLMGFIQLGALMLTR